MSSSSTSPPSRHVTVIPINDVAEEEEAEERGAEGRAPEAAEDMQIEFVEYENHTYGAIFDFEDKPEKADRPEKLVKGAGGSREELKELKSPRRREFSPRRGRERKKEGAPPPPPPHHPVFRRLSERKYEVAEGRINIHKKIRRKSRRSSSLGPLLDLGGSEVGASTHSLESVDSNPRQAVPKSDRGLGAVPRRPHPADPTHPLVGSPTRTVADLPPGVRPPPYHPLAASLAGGGTGPAGFPLMVPLPGLTCQLGSIPPPPAGGLALPPSGAGLAEGGRSLAEAGRVQGEGGRSLREQQVVRLRQELAHPAGVRLILR